VGIKKLINPWSLGIGLLHLILSITITFMSIGSTMARFDDGLPLSQFDQLIGWGAEILNFPLVFLALKIRINAGGVLGWLIFIFNSLLWGLVWGVVLDNSNSHYEK
jgi:hypothetical protein